MCAYFLKDEDETLESLKQGTKEAFVSAKATFETMKHITRAYMTKQESSVEETLYLVLPEL